jgi:terminase small subunit-like protein
MVRLVIQKGKKRLVADDMIDIADGRTNDWIERDGPDGEKVCVSDDENFRRRKKQLGALHWRLSKLKPKRYLRSAKFRFCAGWGRALAHEEPAAAAFLAR